MSIEPHDPRRRCAELAAENERLREALTAMHNHALGHDPDYPGSSHDKASSAALSRPERGTS